MRSPPSVLKTVRPRPWPRPRAAGGLLRRLRGLLLLPALAAGLSSLLVGTAAADPALTPQRWSQLTEISFQHLTQDNGLPNEIATAVAEDGDGFIWIGTLGGLARWDGYRLRVYRADPHTAGSLPDNFIQTLHGDAAGRLWIGTSAAGIVRYDADADRFVAYPVGAGGLSHVSVRAIVDDGAGGLWVASDGGLDHLEPTTGAIRRAAMPGGDAGGLAGKQVHTLLRDHLGRLWAGTPAGLFRRDGDDRPFVRIPLRAAAAQPEPQSLLEDSSGRIWVGTLQHGAFTIATDGRARAVHESTPTTPAAALPIQPVITMAEARPGEVWLGTIGQGIVAVDGASGQTQRISSLPMSAMSLPDNTLRCLFRDRSGLIWAATNRGVSRHGPRQSAILTRFGDPLPDGVRGQATRADARLSASTEVSWILPRAGGRFWLGTHKSGIDIIDSRGARVASLRPDASRPETALPQDVVLAMEPAPDGSVFIGTKRGLYRASADGRRIRRVPLAGRDPSASTWALLVDGDSLWIGGQTDGLWKLDLRSGAAWPMLREAGRQLSDERIIVLARGPAGRLWVGTRFGLNQFDPASGSVWRLTPEPNVAGGLSAGFITALYTDHRARLWIGTYGGGIHIMDGGGPGSARPRLQQVSIPQGLPDDTVDALLEDPAGQVWVSTDNGLARVDPDTLAVRALRRAEGVVFPTYWTGSAARTAEGELLFGGAGGMTVVRPARLQAWDYRPAVVVTDIEVGGRHIVAGHGSTPSALTVPSQANSLRVEFSTTDYSAPERNRYAYKLEGFDHDWVPTDATRRLAAYTNLPPGRYKLLLRGSNRDGLWSERVVELPVQVLPAWYQRLWFRAAAVLALLAALYAVVQLRTRLLRARQAELERKVRERTADLEEVTRALALTSITDPLTGLHNRRFLTEHIDTEIAASLRRAQDTRATSGQAAVDADNVFFLIDVDHFKRVNDVHGHAAGDAVLQQFGQRLRSVMRESDHLVRWGGEEFLAVARDTDRGRAEELAERLRAVVADRPFLLDDGLGLTVTCSIGFACVPFVAQQPRALGWQDVVKLADLAMLAAKRVGRNAWVGLHATTTARAEGLLARVQAAPRQVVQRGELRISSSCDTRAVFDALVPEASGLV